MGNIYSESKQERLINATFEPWVRQATCKHLMDRTWLLDPISRSVGFPHPVYRWTSEQERANVPPPCSEWMKAQHGQTKRPWLHVTSSLPMFTECRTACGWWASSQNHVEIKAWEEALSSGSDSWRQLQGALSSAYPWGWVTKPPNDLSLSNFLLLLEEPLYRTPAAIWSSLLLPQIKEAQRREVKGPAEFQ